MATSLSAIPSAARAFTVECDDGPALTFTGHLVAKTESHDNQARGGMWSGMTGRWHELELYRTAGGKFVCSRIGRTRWQGQRDHYEALAADSEAEVIAFFGHGWLAKALYEDAGIDAAVSVE